MTHKHTHSPAAASGHEHAPAHAHACGKSACETASSPSSPADPLPADKGALRFRIPTMDCAVEESEIRRALEPIAGVSALRFDLSQRVLSLKAEAPPVLEAALAAIRKAGFEPTPLDLAANGSSEDSPAPIASGLPRLLASLFFALLAEGFAFFAPDTRPFQFGAMALAAIAIGLAGFDTYKKGFYALRVGRLNINALMAVAVTGAFLIGQWPEAAMVMALYAIAELIEARAVDKARNAIKTLLAMAPEEAEVLQADGSWLRQLTADVAVGATVRLRPGERVPLDGVITQGASAIDQAPVTGESVPVDKAVGDEVYAGTINQTAALEFRVSALASNSTLARIIHAVEEAQSARAPTQRFVDKFAAIYTPAVFVLALAVAAFMPWLMGWTWLEAVYKALVLLVIACPCALVISTPVTIVSGLAAAARRGILIKGGVYLEQARMLKAVALDKTGTITEGKPRLVEFQPIVAKMDRAALARLALALASRSDHPVSKAIAQGLLSAGEAAAVQDFKAAAGRGVEGRIDGLSYVLGNHRWIEERGQCSPAIEAALRVHEEAGRTVTLLAGEQGVLAICAVADTIKPSSRQAVAELIALGVTPVMLTGDNSATAQAIAAQAGIAEARGNLLPEDKLAAIKELQQRHGPTGMTGDGINDAPALAQADIGFAMGGAGTHTAMEAADVIVMNDDLQRLPETIRLSRRTRSVLVQNIALALGIKGVFLLAALFGNASMWMAVFADMGASLLVVFNGLRLLRSKVS
ncbi:heavy metal translocating P-type ATPase [Paucibacter sp. KCTC 42545]|uniref:heavy metal translocating P-type ATPase n=1 Tax=Paucibacter sp. KCTC 42545 TaxID=1768242 RepID=UPI000733A509|nr:heavy metal translocating P-type ATPase [Paucibacter sp. KCTC 42545]ALT79164.1 4-deoxy-4-formamido-L-arabinose-phospho-UDP deformylase [Paucibacter sp. KCTC 42545]